MPYVGWWGGVGGLILVEDSIVVLLIGQNMYIMDLEIMRY